MTYVIKVQKSILLLVVFISLKPFWPRVKISAKIAWRVYFMKKKIFFKLELIKMCPFKKRAYDMIQ